MIIYLLGYKQGRAPPAYLPVTESGEQVIGGSRFRLLDVMTELKARDFSGDVVDVVPDVVFEKAKLHNLPAKHLVRLEPGILEKALNE